MAVLSICSTLLVLCFISIEAKSLGYKNAHRIPPENDFYQQLEEMLEEREIQQREEPETWPKEIEEVSDWPKTKAFDDIYQVAGISVDNDGKVHVFHRGKYIWGPNTFDLDNIYQDKAKGPITNDTVLILDPKSGDVIKSWGKNRFFMPHGLTIDSHGNSWMTDVALHQVFKFPPNQIEPSLVVGEAFVPGSDYKHFCKPTSVAVASSGIFYVSDGYCNSRVLMFNPQGKFLHSIGSKDWLLIPHSLTLNEEHDHLCVADRENFRVICYSAGLKGSKPGKTLLSIQPPNMGRVFAIDQKGSNLFAVTGKDESGELPSEAALVIDIPRKHLTKAWRPAQGFEMPHDLAVSPDNASLYVVEAGYSAPKKIFKLKLGAK